MTDFFSSMASRVKSIKNTVSLSLTGNSGVWARGLKRSTVWRYIGSRRVRIMKKLDQSKVEWILREKRKNTHDKEIAAKMNVSVRWVQKLWKRYKDEDSIVYPAPMSRPKKSAPGRLEHSTILTILQRRSQRRANVANGLVTNATILIRYGILTTNSLMVADGSYVIRMTHHVLWLVLAYLRRQLQKML